MRHLRAGPHQGPDSEEEQHCRDEELEDDGQPVGQGRAEEGQDEADPQEREGVTEPPERAQPETRARVILLGDQGGDRREVVGLEGMAHAQEQTEEPGGDGGQGYLPRARCITPRVEGPAALLAPGCQPLPLNVRRRHPCAKRPGRDRGRNRTTRERAMKRKEMIGILAVAGARRSGRVSRVPGRAAGSGVDDLGARQPRPEREPGSRAGREHRRARLRRNGVHRSPSSMERVGTGGSGDAGYGARDAGMR